MDINNCLIGQKGFPPIYSQTSLCFLKRCPGFFRAKDGDIQAAQAVVNLCVKPWRIEEIRKKYPYAVLLPLAGKNKLPEAYAHEIGLKTQSGVHLARSGIEIETVKGVLHNQFVGEIDKGTYYILVDDIISRGGTSTALRKYVLSKGGFVCAVAALAHTANGFVPVYENIVNLRKLHAYARIA